MPKRTRQKQEQLNDPYLEMVLEIWPEMAGCYEAHAEKKPILLFDVQEQRVYVYPYREFKADLNERSQAMLTEQYEKSLAENEVVVFVRDNIERKFVSFSLPRESPAEPSSKTKGRKKPKR
jgi:hypothetical protein